MPPRALLPLLLAVPLCLPSPAQQVHPAQQLLLAGLGAMDDVEITPSPSVWLVALPAQQIVAFVDAQLVLTTVTVGAVHGMALEPGGLALWVTDFGPGTLRRIDLATLQVTHTFGGFGHPHEIVFLDPQTALVASMATYDFWTSPASVSRVVLDPGGAPPAVTPLAAGLVGGVDVVANAEGRLFATSLGSDVIREIDPLTGALTPLPGTVPQPTDLVQGPGNSVYVCTLFGSQILRLDPDPAAPSLVPITAFVGGFGGHGCEDLAIDAEGQLLVAMNHGEIHRVRVRGELVQEGFAVGGFPFVISLDLPAHPGREVALAASLGSSPGIPVPGTSSVLPLNPDTLFFLSLDPGSGLGLGTGFQLDSGGRARILVSPPPLPSGLVLDTVVGAVVHQGNQIQHVPDGIHVRLFGY